MEKFALFIVLICQGALGQMGINTTNPQQALHIAGTTGSLRLDHLNSANNSFNGGDADGDLDMTNDTYPLYVDENGNFTLELKMEEATEEMDAFDDSSLPNSAVSLLSTNVSGSVETLIKSYSVTVSRPSIVEVKYILSFEVFLDPFGTTITDNLSRQIQTHITVTGQTRKYGLANKCYASGSVASVNGTLFNSNTAYISLPSAGTYNIDFYGAVSSDVKSGGGGSISQSTYVEFATGNDFVLIRLH
ncbi:MAG: hypothetical protein HKN48_00930 [Flavobacteriaceae bacterium]|nr:hypothetical protein [Flavobacteriaceae bacterium]